MAQAHWVRDQLTSKNANLSVTIDGIRTQGDRDANASLAAIGGKGVFVKEIEDALLRQEIDVAVHSLKDVPQKLPDGLILGSHPKRENPRDVLISRVGKLIHELPKGSKVGTGSPRRRAQIQYRYHEHQYKFEPVRGNVETRIEKLKKGQVDALVLALAGLKRLGLEDEITQILEPEIMLPAACQGAIGLEIRREDDELIKILETIKDPESDCCIRAERAFLKGIGGDCTIPLGALAHVSKREIKMKAVLLNEEGSQLVKAEESGALDRPEYVGSLLAERILHDGGSDIILASKARHCK